MIAHLVSFILTVFGPLKALAVIILAMIPVIELRGAIPIAVEIVPWWQAYGLSVLGSTIPALFIIPLLIPLFNAMKKTKWFSRLAIALENRFKGKSLKVQQEVDEQVNKSKKERVKFWGILAFVAVPFPLTGAWTGSAIASYLNFGFWKSVLAVFLGNIISGAIMTVLCLLFKEYVDVILYSFLGLVLIVVAVSIVVAIVKSKKLKSKQNVSTANVDNN